MKQGCDGGLSASAAAIHGQNPRPAIMSSVSIEKQTDEPTDRRYSPWTGHGSPGPSFMFTSKFFPYRLAEKGQTNVSLGFRNSRNPSLAICPFGGQT
jgi:hypothetical protein